MNSPTNFRPGGGPSLHPQAQPARLVQVPDLAPGYAPRDVPVLTVYRHQGWVYLNAEACRRLPPGDGTLDLRPPARPRDAWRLDCRPASASTANPAAKGLRFRAPARAALLFAHIPENQAFLRFALAPDPASPLLFLLHPCAGVEN